MDLYINGFSFICGLGYNFKNALEGLLGCDKRGMIALNDVVYGKTIRFGAVEPTLLPEIPPPLLDIAGNRILLFCLQNLRKEIDVLKAKYGPDRIAIVMGGCNSGIHEVLSALQMYYEEGALPHWFRISMQEESTLSDFAAAYTGITGPSYSISTACSSSLKAFASARNLIQSGLCDAAIVGGADSLCSYAVNGFNMLEVLAEGYANPFSQSRDGINLGEAGALFVLSKDSAELGGCRLKIVGIGETSDAYHASTPLPDGSQARKAMETALWDASLSSADIDYVSLHGTGTIHNDSMESLAVYNVFGSNTPCGSMKPLIGHTLGCSGAVELALNCLLLMPEINPDGLLPPHPWDGVRDKTLKPVNLVIPGTKVDNLRYILSNAFAFGGSNASIIVGKE